MTMVFETTDSCMSSSMTWTLLSVLIFSGSAGFVVRMDEDTSPILVFDAVVCRDPDFAWCDLLDKARAKQRRQVRSFKAPDNSDNQVVMAT